MEAYKALRLPNCDYVGSTNIHSVVLIESKDSPVIKDGELDDFLWWDGKVDLHCYPHEACQCSVRIL